MTHDEWLAERKKGIGGSDAAAIVGLSPYKSAFEVYADKLDLIPPKGDNEAMRQGRDLEEYVAKRFCEDTNKRVRRHNEFIRNIKYPFAFANVDRLIVGEKAGLECKTASVLNLRRYKNGEYPSEYYCQCVHYMAVTGYDRWYLAVLVLGRDFKIYTIERDQSEIDALMDAERAFWEENVSRHIPPAPDGSDSADDIINALYPKDDGGEIQLYGLKDSISRIDEIKQLLEKLEEEKQELEQKIKLEMGTAERAYIGERKILWQNRTRSSINIGELKEDYNITNIDEYKKITNYRVFKIEEEK